MTGQPNSIPISIIIPVYNGAKFLPDTLRSIQNQDYKDYELLVVDDGSTDETAQIAESAGAKVIKLSQNSGPATARNEGARAAQGEILLFTDSDVLLPKNAVTKLLTAFKQNHTDAVQGTFSDVCPFPNYFSQYKNLYNRYVLNQLPDWIDTTFTSITAVTRSAFISCGGFDQNIRTASVEDRTLGRNLIKHGYKILLDRSVEVIHNKNLSWKGFLRNQYRRSKDLAKLLLRNAVEKKAENPIPRPIDKSGRFGTNSLSTMIRIPVAYLLLFFLGLMGWIPVFGVLCGAFGIFYLWLIAGFELYLIEKRGIFFALNGIPANLIDALLSGLGIARGIWEFFLVKKKY